MKHAFLITAYNQPELLALLIEKLNSQESLFYIHIDLKSNWMWDSSQIQYLKTLPNVYFEGDRINVNWGAFSHTRAILKLIHKALENQEIGYFHTISGQDIPIKSIDYFLDFFQKNSGKQFMMNKKVPTPDWKGGGLNRIQYYHLNDYLNPKKFILGKIVRIMVILQSIFHLKRTLPNQFGQLYGGHVWWSLNRPCIQYICEYLAMNPSFLDRFKHTFCSEEIIFQTIVMNSDFSSVVVNNNMRYVDMVRRNGNSPAILDKTDIPKLEKSERLFARKISLKYSRDVIQRFS